MKRLIVGTALGRRAISARDSFQRARIALVHPEVAGTVANDQLAATITTRLCAAGKTFLDIGAHIGSMTAEVLHHCPSSKVIAVEAIPEKAAFLRRKFPTVDCHACALGESDGETSFFIDVRKTGYSSLATPSAAGGSDYVEIKVPLSRLDSLVHGRDVDVIKIDVEGAELGVLRGGERLVADCRPIIMFESGPDSGHAMGYTKPMLWHWFADRGYAVLIPNRLAHEDQGLSEASFLESHLYPRRTTNYFAVPGERRDELRFRAYEILGLGA